MNTLAELESYVANLIERVKADPRNLDATRELYTLIKGTDEPRLAELAQLLANVLLSAQVLQWQQDGDPRYEEFKNLMADELYRRFNAK